MAGYLELRNTGGESIVVVGFSSPDFDRIHMHDTVHEGGMARMVSLEELEVMPGEMVSFQPGGRHLMLLDPKRALEKGDSVRIDMQTNLGERRLEFAVIVPGD